MANTAISALTAATSIAGTDTIVLVQGGVTKKGTVSLLPSGSGGLGDLRPRTSASWYVNPSATTAASTTPDYQREYASPLLLNPGQGVNGLGVYIASAGSAGSVVRLGIRADDTHGKPAGLLADFGTVSGVTTGVQSVTATGYTNSGSSTVLVWLIICCQVGTTPPGMQMFTGHNLFGDIIAQGSAGQDNNDVGYESTTAVTGALASTAPTFGGANFAPKLYFRAV